MGHLKFCCCYIFFIFFGYHSIIPVKVAAPELQFEHVIPAYQDDPAEDEDGRGDEQEDVADVEEPLVL